MITLDKAAQLLLENDDIYILTHQFPDGDTLGSGFALCRALQKLQKKARVIISGEMPDKFLYLKNGVEEQEFSCKYVVSVDVADINLLGDKKEEYNGRINLAIDHHELHRAFAENEYIEGDSAANAEIIYALIEKMGVTPDKHIADCIFTGICTDTGCFRYPNASPRSFRIAAQMMENGANSAEISRIMFDTKSKARINIERRVLDSMEYFADGKASIIYITRAMIAETGATEGDIDGLSAIPRQVEGVIAGVTMREKKDGDYKISLRTLPGCNAANICALFGGGGHKAAAGCTISGPLEQAKEKIMCAVTKALS